MWIQNRFFKYAFGALLVVLILFFLGKVDYLFTPIQQLITILFFPIIIAGLFYYILRTPVDFLDKHMPKTLAILLMFAVIIGLFYGLWYFAGSMIASQTNNLAAELPQKIEQTVKFAKEFIRSSNFEMISVHEVENKIADYLQSLFDSVSQNVMTVLSAITSVITVLLVVPFIIFFFLRDGDKFLPYLLHFLPRKHKDEGKRLLKDIDKTLFTYIVGQFFVASVNGAFMYIGYLIIGLDFAIVLALFVVITNMVPIIGPAIGVIPAIIIGISQDPFMVVKILIVLTIVQQLEGNLVSPYILGNKLHLHPLTVLLLLLAAGSLYGFVGILIVIPLYAILKVTVKNLYRFYKLRYSE
ncbi:AI-2E family transporter [Bacillus taeanensis]|uniref:AI-2E family transporter n=1 Tax=Bacillus taeanensis TaxID=273032 RepID=A0A366XVH9_9BACI|nr:AI-2E family transporter [Bacillus taeanensis]RBW70142.1 AI-2E family transporter [Bacillus taeanensis]